MLGDIVRRDAGGGNMSNDRCTLCGSREEGHEHHIRRTPKGWEAWINPEEPASTFEDGLLMIRQALKCWLFGHRVIIVWSDKFTCVNCGTWWQIGDATQS